MTADRGIIGSMDRENEIEIPVDLLEETVKRQKSTYIAALRDMGLSEAYIEHVDKNWYRDIAARHSN